VDEATPKTDLWPDNIGAVNVFISMSTQWRVGMGGPTGLDYNALASVMDLVGVPKEDRPAIFDDVRVLEDAALETIRKQQK